MADTQSGRQDAWERLKAVARAEDAARIEGLFDADPQRLQRLTLETCGLYVDLSKQPWSRAGLTAALDLAKAADVEGARDRLFAGEAVNASEGRAALTWPWRAPGDRHSAPSGGPSPPRSRPPAPAMADFAEGLPFRRRRGPPPASGSALLSTSASAVGPGARLIWEALKPLDAAIDLRFAANVDGADIAAALHGLNPAETLVIAVSKTFTTQETLTNATAARDWLAGALGQDAVGAHFAAVSANVPAAMAFGLREDRIFGFWDWVGGRYSLWSAVGLSCAIGLGWPAFQALLDGAWTMDEHFRQAPLAANAPVLLALAHVYNRNALGRQVRAVIPYARRLGLLPSFLQQLEMESNGKSVSLTGDPAPESTASVVFGEVGTNSQHAFFQLLHQGVDVIPVDIVAIAETDEGPAGFHARLLANAVAQAEALMTGRPAKSDADTLARQKDYPGDRPTGFLLMQRLTPSLAGVPDRPARAQGVRRRRPVGHQQLRSMGR